MPIIYQEKIQNKNKKPKPLHTTIIIICIIIFLASIFYLYKIGLVSKLLIGRAQIVVTNLEETWGYQKWMISKRGIVYFENLTRGNILRNFLTSRNSLHFIKKEDFNQIITYLSKSDLFGNDFKYCKNISKDLRKLQIGFGYCSGMGYVEVDYYKCKTFDTCFGLPDNESVNMRDFINNLDSILSKYEINLMGEHSIDTIYNNYD